jgi:serine/threonine-protein kinase
MAAVYEARRADEQFEQRVAIKIMDLRLSDPALVAQFRAERQILAALEHPALTRLLDGGVTALGEPYLVMELVDGEPIDVFCDRQRLGLPARLRLFIEVCDGVAFAHRNLVLHRDLKPSNILVTRDGRPKVVDFGTATLLQPERLATVSRAPLTPAYASPEQLTGQAVGTASDQYSLGLVLYALLTGVVPFGDRTSLMASIERALSGAPPAPAGSVVTDEAASVRQTSVLRLRRQLAGDLGTILAKALAADPAARYSSVQHLADDLVRWGDGEPILGRTPSLRYRATRFVQRHWAAVSTASALALSLVVATAVSFQQAGVARAESGKARELNRFLTQMLSSANPSWYNANAGSAGTITVREVLDGAGQLIPSELGDTPEVEAEMRRTLGRTYIGMGATEEALPHLERAEALYRDQDDAFGIAFTRMMLAERHLLRGEAAHAESVLREVLAYIRGRGDAADPELHLIATNDLAVAISAQRPGQEESFALLRESIAVADRTGLNPGGAAVGMTNLGTELFKAGRLDESEAAFRDAARRMEALPFMPPERNGVYNNLSNVLRARGAMDEAKQAGQAAVEGGARVWPPEHPFQAAVKNTWGRALVLGGEPERGREQLTAALALFTKLRPAGHFDFIAPLTGIGTAARLLGDLDESERRLREAIAIARKHPALVDRLADATSELGLTLRARGDGAGGDALLREGHALFTTAFGDAHPSTRRVLAHLEGR